MEITDTCFILGLSTALEARRLAPWQRKLADYLILGGDVGRLEVREQYASTAEKLADELPKLRRSIVICSPCFAAQGYFIAVTSETSQDTGERNVVVFSEDGKAVAANVGGDVYVDPLHRGRRLGSELMLARAVLDGGGGLDGSLYSPGGISAAVLSHQMAMEMAVAAGKKVAVVQEGVYAKMRERLVPAADGYRP